MEAMTTDRLSLKLGARPEKGGVRFRVWAPSARRMQVVLEGQGAEKPMAQRAGGHFEAFVPGLAAGALYRYRVNGKDVYPDPASRFQPQGVHGPSMVVDPGMKAKRRAGEVTK